MFTGCKKIKRIDLSNWNFTHINNISFLFENCKTLTLINIPNIIKKFITFRTLAEFQKLNINKIISNNFTIRESVSLLNITINLFTLNILS